MDRLVYVAMTGARETQLAQAITTNNLANASTTGFRATLASAAHVPVTGPGHAQARAYAVTQGQGLDLTPGTLQATGRDLDVAIDGQGWLAVLAADGTEAYTRAGDLRVDALGQLVTRSGHQVLGEGGFIALPPYESVVIAGDGTISVRAQGQDAAALVVLDRIKLVNPPAAELQLGNDGLVRLRDGGSAPSEPNVQLVSGMLETSNVNVVGALVEMIQHARSFELQTKMMSTAEENDRVSSSLLRLS